MRTRKHKTQPEALPVGARVKVRFPGGVLNAEVVEDRGFLGIGGRQIVRVRAVEETDLPSDFEIPAEDVEVLSLPKKNGRRAA
jgi:hypothetical protein